ncbi:hypothetical protein O6P43_003518 [Quillaja saponaria]|uniref:Uncharacterized protein n=1 Tax=Quillaja saponaria TaxID=32244 RepID=A0AAD7QEV6_QUISA|nr:hypothetical protein O6P43_003518 [Quillaja saponaria]
MGCGKSKHDVVTGNTNPQHKKINDIETTQEADRNDNNNINNNVTPETQQEEIEIVNDVVESTNGADLKDIEENAKLQEENNDDGVEKLEVENLIAKDLPNNFLSSRKYEKGLDGIVSEGLSENSQYNTPSHGAGVKEDLLSENEKEDDIVGEKELPEQTKAKTENVLTSSTDEEDLKADEVHIGV